jgi:hypothetical protein
MATFGAIPATQQHNPNKSFEAGTHLLALLQPISFGFLRRFCDTVDGVSSFEAESEIWFMFMFWVSAL